MSIFLQVGKNIIFGYNARMFKNFLMKQMLKRQLKGVPEAEQERIIKVVSENPEIFQKIGDEVKAKVKSGMAESNATLVVMQKYKDELQKLMMK